MRWRLGLLVGMVAAFLVSDGRASAATLERVGVFDSPVFVTSDPTNADRLFVVEQYGRIKVLENGVERTFLDLSSAGLLIAGGERGLLSMALPQDFATSGRFYVFYTRRGTGNLQIDEFTSAGGNVSLASRRPVLEIPHEPGSNHNGGQLQFGPDGYLYIGTGDGGGSGDPLEHAQSLGSLLGKILRIDPRSGGAAAYTVPADNPFADGPGGSLDEIWSYGLRNPWRFSFDRLTGDLLIGDVGQARWEEIDLAPAPAAGRGVNFGWDCREGRHPFESQGCSPFAALTDPIFEYPNTGSSAVAGGYVVRDPGLGGLIGRYVYADTVEGEIHSLTPILPTAPDDRSERLGADFISSFGEDACGRIYVASLSGPVYRLVGDTPTACLGAGGGAAKTCGRRNATIAAPPRRLVGTPRDDVIVGTARRDRIKGRGGDDLICARRGKDRLGGQRGKDRLKGGAGSDRCIGGPGRDRERSCS